MDITDQIDFIKEMIHPLYTIEEEPLKSNNSPIRKNSLIWNKEIYLLNLMCKNLSTSNDKYR